MIDYFSIGHPLTRLRSHFAIRARQRMFRLFMQHSQIDAGSKVLDLGVTPDRTLPESNHFEQVFPYPANLTAASIESVDDLAAHFPKIRFTRIAPGPLPFDARQFDACFCSAVIEHVGSRERQAEFICEISRVSRFLCVTTPNRWFPLDFHTILPLIHWLPQRWHQAALRFLGKDFWAATDNLNLMSARDLLGMLPDYLEGHVIKIRLLGMTSNLVLIAKHRSG